MIIHHFTGVFLRLSRLHVFVPCARAAYIAEYGSNVVRLVWLNGSISTVAGNGTAGFAGQGVPAVQALLRGPSSLAYDGLGGILIAVSNSRLLQISTSAWFYV